MCHKFQSHSPSVVTPAVGKPEERSEDMDPLANDAAALEVTQGDVSKDHQVELGASDGAYDQEELQFMMGVSLTLGFVFMLLVDQCAGGHSHAPSADTEGGGGGRHARRNLTATIGLVVHAAGILKELFVCI